MNTVLCFKTFCFKFLTPFPLPISGDANFSKSWWGWIESNRSFKCLHNGTSSWNLVIFPPSQLYIKFGL